MRQRFIINNFSYSKELAVVSSESAAFFLSLFHVALRTTDWPSACRKAEHSQRIKITAIFMKKNIVIGALMLIVGIVGGWLCRGVRSDKAEPVIQTDTIIKVDIVREAYPIEISKEVVRKEYVIVRDTVRIKDTLYLSLPMERRVYGSDDFYAEVTGYKPSLDYIEVFPKTKIITERIVERRKMNSLSAGIELGYMNGLTLPIYLEYERMLQKNVGIYGQMLYDLNARQFGISAGVHLQLEW